MEGHLWPDSKGENIWTKRSITALPTDRPVPLPPCGHDERTGAGGKPLASSQEGPRSSLEASASWAKLAVRKRLLGVCFTSSSPFQRHVPPPRLCLVQTGPFASFWNFTSRGRHTPFCAAEPCWNGLCPRACLLGAEISNNTRCFLVQASVACLLEMRTPFVPRTERAGSGPLLFLAHFSLGDSK